MLPGINNCSMDCFLLIKFKFLYAFGVCTKHLRNSYPKHPKLNVSGNVLQTPHPPRNLKYI